MTLPLLTAAVLLTYKTFVFDLDGVLKANSVIAQAPEIVNYLYEKNKEVGLADQATRTGPEKSTENKSHFCIEQIGNCFFSKLMNHLKFTVNY